MSRNQYKLFFSWQSDDTKSRKILDIALQKAVQELQDHGIVLNVDHSTLGESGSPSIDQTILRKIDSCDIFLADVTPIYNFQKQLGNGQSIIKEIPNPNVLIELGYAMSAIGVEYVIVAAHQGKWNIANMPFDINHHPIYSFTSSDCNITTRILNIIEYIKKNGRHRHLDEPYWINKLKLFLDKFKKNPIINVPTISNESTVFFSMRLANAFPGYRGLNEFTKPKDINLHLSKLLESPITFKKSIIGVIDPIWWFRGHSALNINKFRRLGRRKFLMGMDELIIRKIVVYIDNGRYYSNFVYVEVQAENPTGLYPKPSQKKFNELKELLGFVREEYAIYKPFSFFHKKVTSQEENDGSTKILGKIVKMKREYVETRIRYITDYNFIIAAKGSAFNNPIFDRTSEDYFNGLLNGTVSIDDFRNYLLQFPKPNNLEIQY